MNLTLPQNPENLSFISDGLCEIIGEELLQELTLKESPSAAVSFLQGIKIALESQFDVPAARGILIRAGRAGFYYWMRKSSQSLGWKESEFRLLPTRTKTKQAMADLFHWMEKEKLIKAEVEESSITWHVSVSGLTRAEAILECNFFAGMIQELFNWAGSGKYYRTNETKCQSSGEPCCVFLVDKVPLD